MVEEKKDDADRQYGLFDYAQLLVWYISLAFFVYWKGWPTGILLYGVSMGVTALLLKLCFGLEMMSGGDEIFFQEDSRNSTNIISFQKYEKFDSDKMAHQMVSRACAFPRLKSRVVKFLGKYMF